MWSEIYLSRISSHRVDTETFAYMRVTLRVPGIGTEVINSITARMIIEFVVSVGERERVRVRP